MADSSKNTKQTAEIDAIRNIIFGEQIQDYDSRFEALKEDMGKTHKKLEGKLDTLQHEMKESIANLQASIDKIISSSHQETLKELEKLKAEKADKKEIGQFLVDLGNKLME